MNKKNILLLFLGLAIFQLLISPALFSQKIYGGYYTAERVKNLRQNCDNYDWAQEKKRIVIEKATPWVAMEDDVLWAMVPGQDLPRCIDVTFDRLADGPKSLGCLKCGNDIKKFGNYPYTPDFVNRSWKLTCPSCQIVFPTNDFQKFYLSAIDEHGLFNPADGDRSLLFNENHPNPDDPLHKFGVDDGFGYIDENGRAHKFIGYYSWKYWMYLNDGLESLADAFLYTGEKRYAHKAAILLDRIADVYPDMDWKPYADRGWYHSDGGTHLGKIEGSIWETTVVQKFAESYDKILSGTVDAPKLFAFLQSQSEKYQLPSNKGTRDFFLQNIDQRILKTAFEAVLSQQIRGNQGMHQLTVAMSAIALNEEPQTTRWLDWLFAPDGGAIPGLMISQLDRDGTSDEGAPGYSLMWGKLITQLASWLAEYSSYTKHNIFKDYPQFRATFLAAYRMAVLGIAVPNIGDSGATGLVTNKQVDPEFMALGYSYTQDPEIAIAAYRANGNSALGLGRNLFLDDPDALGKEIQAIAEKAGLRPEGGTLMSGFGLASLESGTGSDGIAVVSNHGRTIKHAHPDMLNFDIFAFGAWLTPDHGYPEFATRWASNAEWTGSTISHNTVYVNERPQKEVWGGKTKIFKQLNGFGVFELDGEKSYPEVEKYTRTLFLISGTDDTQKENHAYVVDIFRVNGGYDHVYSFHGPPGKMTSTGLNLSIQEKGTYAGEDIPKGAWAEDFPIGYSHLYNVRKDLNPAGQFMVDWKAQAGYSELGTEDDVHLRLHSLSQSQDIALAEGDPPQNKPSNPESLGYLLMHRSGDTLSSNFVSIIEPYRNTPFIKTIERIDDGQGEEVALKITRIDGVNDYLLYNPVPQNKILLPNGLSMTGTIGFIQEKNGTMKKGVLVNGTSLEYDNLKLVSAGEIRGKILAMNKELKGGGWLIVDTRLPTDGSLLGHQIHIETTGDRDASYTILDITISNGKSRIYCGPISFINSYKGGSMTVRKATVPKSYKEGYLFDFEEGANFTIATHKEWSQ